MSKVYDNLMKSGRFTAAQNKSVTGDCVDSISELVALCEKDGFIPRYYVDGPQDKVDRTLQDLQSYTRSLVTEEMGLGNLIENAIKQIEFEKERNNVDEAEAANDDEALENRLFSEEPVESLLNDEDFADLRQLEDDLEDEDDKTLLSLLEGED